MKLKLLFTLLLLTNIILAQEVFTDIRDSNQYKTVKIGKQIWMAENLAFKTDSGCWAYNENADSIAKYGYYYNWETALNVCPAGWRLPTKKDFKTLLANYGGEGNKAYRALENGGSSGFNAIKCGSYMGSNVFWSVNNYAEFWTTDSIDEQTIIKFYLCKIFHIAGTDYWMKESGLSVRCIKE